MSGRTAGIIDRRVQRESRVVRGMGRALPLSVVLCLFSASLWAGDPNPFATYGAAMKGVNGDPNAVEWQDDNRDLIAAATAEDVLADLVKDELSATRLLAQLRGAYSSSPRALTQIAAVTAWVMGEEPCCLCFWKPSPAAGRKVWVAALEKKLRLADDDYAKTVCRQQLERCGYEGDCPLIGSWALFLPYDKMTGGHLLVTRGADGKLSGKMLMRGSSPEPCTNLVCAADGTFTAVRARFAVTGKICGDAADCILTQFDDAGKTVFGPKAFRAVRNPPIDPGASVRQATFGEPIDLLAQGLEGFAPMSADGEFGWSFKDGVLSNRVSQKDTNRHGRGINICTKRADFYDFNIEYDVRVPKGANSGVYLRGRYELQVNDSYGRPLDCHNMAALYGRITPLVAAEKPAGEWQHVSATIYKRHLTVVLNGQTIIDDQPVEGITGGALDANEFVPGPIYLQGDHTDADYRNMILRPVTNPANAAPLSASSAPAPQNVPDLMTCEDGTPVKTVSDWEDKRRGEILEFFVREEYGRRPVDRPADLRFELAETDAVMMDGAAIRKRIRASWTGPRGPWSFVFTAFIPKKAADASRKSPSFVLICNRSVENIDPTRKKKSFFWPAEEIVDRGYAAIAFWNGDLAPDDKSPVFTNGVYKIYGDRGRDTWGALSAWAWGASRVMDWIETEPTLDAAHVGVVGHSRGGKTALVAGVTDKRFAMACSNCSGCSGAKLNHIELPKSESVKVITGAFRHWFSLEYDKWADRECEMPYDQHEWIALMAPRLVAIASASEDDWAGQLGEFQAGRLASPAWELYGKKGLVAPEVPPTVGDRPADGLCYQEGSVSYHIRPGQHTLSAYDWHRYLDFADRHGWRTAD